MTEQRQSPSSSRGQGALSPQALASPTVLGRKVVALRLDGLRSPTKNTSSPKSYEEKEGTGKAKLLSPTLTFNIGALQTVTVQMGKKITQDHKSKKTKESKSEDEVASSTPRTAPLPRPASPLDIDLKPTARTDAPWRTSEYRETELSSQHSQEPCPSPLERLESVSVYSVEKEGETARLIEAPSPASGDPPLPSRLLPAVMDVTVSSPSSATTLTTDQEREKTKIQISSPSSSSSAPISPAQRSGNDAKQASESLGFGKKDLGPVKVTSKHQSFGGAKSQQRDKLVGSPSSILGSNSSKTASFGSPATVRRPLDTVKEKGEKPQGAGGGREVTGVVLPAKTRDSFYGPEVKPRSDSLPMPLGPGKDGTTPAFLPVLPQPARPKSGLLSPRDGSSRSSSKK